MKDTKFKDSATMTGWLGVFVYPNAYVYADRRVTDTETNDYLEICRIVFEPKMELKIYHNTNKYAPVIHMAKKEIERLKKSDCFSLPKRKI